MKNGDISNDLPARVLVNTDVFSTITFRTEKRFKILPVLKSDMQLRMDVLSRLYLFTSKHGVTLEVVSYELSTSQMDDLMLRLDELGTNPFRYGVAYNSIEELIGALPYRPEVVGVVDIPRRQGRYGHWGMDFNQLQ